MDFNERPPQSQAPKVATQTPPAPETPPVAADMLSWETLFLVELLLCAKDVLLALALIAGLDSLQMYLHSGSLDLAVWQHQGNILVLLTGLAIPIVYLALLLHEGGHLLAGRLVGFWFVSLRVRSFCFRRARRGIHFALSERPKTGGEVVSLPTGDHSLRLRQGIFVAGGPLASLLLTLLVWGLLAHTLKCCPASDSSTDDLLSLFGQATPGTRLLLWALALLAAKSAITFVGAILPYRFGRMQSDGSLLLKLAQDGRAAEMRLLVSAMRSYALRRVLPRDWPPNLAARAAVLADGTFYGHLAALYAYSWALDTGTDSAGLLLDRAIATCPDPTRPPPALAFEAAYFEARYRQNSEKARAWLEQASGRGSEFAPVLGPRAEAALLLLEGQSQAAFDRAGEGLAAHEAPGAGGSLSSFWLEAEHLRELQAEARRQINSPSPDRQS